MDCFVPLADMINHSRPSNADYYYDNTDDCLVLEALEDIPMGKEVTINYGRKCNSRFFMNYGFIN